MFSFQKNYYIYNASISCNLNQYNVSYFKQFQRITISTNIQSDNNDAEKTHVFRGQQKGNLIYMYNFKQVHIKTNNLGDFLNIYHLANEYYYNFIFKEIFLEFVWIRCHVKE